MPMEQPDRQLTLPWRESRLYRRDRKLATPVFTSMKNATPESIGLVEMTRSAIISSDDPELEEMDDPSRIPPGRGI